MAGTFHCCCGYSIDKPVVFVRGERSEFILEMFNGLFHLGQAVLLVITWAVIFEIGLQMTVLRSAVRSRNGEYQSELGNRPLEP